MDTNFYRKSFYKILSILLALSLVLSMLPVWVNAETTGDYCNGTDMYSIGSIEYFANTDDEDKLYKTDLSDDSVNLVLAEHIISMVFCEQSLYLLAYRDGDSVLMRFDPEEESSVDLVTISGVVSNIACRDQILYYITDGNIVSYYLTNKTSNVLIDTGNVSLLYFADYNNMRYYTETDGKTVENTYSFDKHGAEQQEEQCGRPMKTATSYTPRLTAPATDNPYYTTLNVFHQCGYGMAPNIGNCTCYAFGRSYENLGTEPKLSHGNAGEWYDYNRNNGYYSYGTTPVLGAVAVWKSGGAGHVAVVEVIDGDTVTTSESGWKSFYFKTVTRSASNSNFSASSYYSFQGFIYVMGTSTSSQPSNLGIQSDREIYPDHEVIHLTWEVDAPNGYNLHLVDVNTEQRLDILYPHSNKYYDIMGLPAGNYRVALYTFDENNNYSFHSVTEFSVCTEKPLENNTLCADKKTYKKSDTVYLSWSASTLLYDLHVSYNNGSDVIYETGKTSYELSNLAVGQYRIALYTLNDYGWTCGNAITFSVIEDHICNKSEYVFYESIHPHYKCYRCSICGEIWRNFDEATMIDSCLECHRPATPVLLGMREIYDPNENIVFNWNATINTTHYNAYFDKRNSNGEFARIENAFYVESGFSRKLEKGYYRILLQSTNSNYFEADGSSWLFSEGDWVEFEVSHNYKDIVISPTCTAQGYTTHTCTACGDSYKDTYTAALGHNYSYKVTSTPTAPATGVLTGTCSRCSGTTTVTLPKLNTTDYSYSVVKAATCTATGTGRYTWKTTTYGNFYFDVTIAKTAHNYTATVTAPTCTAQGYTTHTCTACGDSYKDTYTAALDHNYSYKVTTTPTDSVTGVLTGTCSRCGGTTTVTLPKLNTTDYSYSIVKAATCTATGTGRYTWKTTTYGNFYFDVTIAKTAHNYTATVTAPTCTAQGYTTHTCTACGDSYKDTYTAALGHNYGYKVTTTPTDSVTGALTGTCSRCSGTTTVTLPKLNTTDYSYSVVKAATCTAVGTGRYTWKTTTYGNLYFDVTIAKTAHNYTATVTAPTCTAQGYTTHTCTGCGDNYKDTYTAVLGHSESAWIVDRNATCTASGSKHTECTRCGMMMQTETIAANGHTAGAWIIDKNATCTASGTKHTECTVCGATLETAIIAAKGHTTSAWIIDKNASCTASGMKHTECTVCGATLETATISATGHSYGYTDNSDGTHTATCANCGYSFTEAHAFTDGACVCGAEESTEPTLDSAISIGQQLFLESDLTMNFRVKESQLTAYDVSTAYLVVERDIYPSGGEMYVQTETLTDYTIVSERLVFVYTGIASAQMNDDIRATLHIKDSSGKEYVSSTLTTSVTAYAKLLLDTYGTTNEKLCTVLMDLLNYGTAAQLYFNRHTDAPANTAYAAFADYAGYASAGLVSPLEDLSTVITNEGATATMSQSVELATSIGVTYKVTLPDGVIAADAVVVLRDADGNELETLSLADATVDAKGRYVVTYFGSQSRQMRRVVFGTVYVGDAAISNTYGYSISTYAYQIANTSGMPEKLVNLTNLMVAYGDAASAYFSG